MKWKTSVAAVALFLLLTVTGQAQVATMEWQQASGGGALGAAGTGLALIGLSRPMNSQMLAERRTAYKAALPADHHAVVKHGAADANAAYRETENTEKAVVTTYHCADGRDRTINWATNAIRVEQSGQPITAFHYSNRTDLQRALLRDGCIEEMPTRAIGHDDVRQIPTMPPLRYSGATSPAGPAKSGTPTASLIEQTMARRRAEGGRCSGGKK